MEDGGLEMIALVPKWLRITMLRVFRLCAACVLMYEGVPFLCF